MTDTPWYRRTRRWAQTNLVEIDPVRYDTEWWRQYWRDTRIQGVIVNAGGIVAYYPSEHPLHHRAEHLGDRDLYGEIVAAAREEGLTVIARMDSNRVAEDFARAHPDWMAVDRDGRPYRIADKWITCINSPYYQEYLPGVMREIIERSHPDGFADNSWAGLPRDRICHCRHCRASFGEWSGGLPVPAVADFDDEGYRRWIRWNYQRRIDLWELNDRVTTEAGGPDCHWFGMVGGDLVYQANRFVDTRRILARSEAVMLDHQHRNPVDGFEQNAEVGKRLHGLLGWDKLIPESTPMYQLGRPAFRLSSMPAAEAQLWASSGWAGGIQPWWHHIGSLHEDRRQYETSKPILRWHEQNEDVLFDREPVADVGVVWSLDTIDFFGREAPVERALDPYRGAVQALTDAGIPYLPVHVDDIPTDPSLLRVLVLPNVAAMSDAQARAVEAYVAAGGSIVATGETSRYDQDGALRPDYALASLLGVHAGSGYRGGWGPETTDIEFPIRHSYLRLSPELRAGVDGPHDATAPEASGERHPVLGGLEKTDTIPFGGYLPVVTAADDATVLATFVPEFPIYPPETSWMRTPYSDLPGIVVREAPGGGRVAMLVADLDRCAARDKQPDHVRILANAVRWGLRGRSSVEVSSEYRVFPSLYAQGGARSILHLNSTLLLNSVPGRQELVVPSGPVTVRIPLEGRGAPDAVVLRVAGGETPARVEDDALVFEVPRVEAHEVAVVDWA